MWSVMLAGATLVVLVVMALLLLGLRHRAPTREVSQTLWLGWGAVGFVSITLLALLAYAFVVGERLRPLTGPDLVTVRATAGQWHWRFGYGGSRGETDSVLVIPVGRVVNVEVTATDVIHAFWVPRLAGKIDAIPGHVNHLRLETSRPGHFSGLCAEFCGIGHRAHGFTVVALDPVAWDAFMAGATPPPATERDRDE